ncbi:hypothetical protein LAUMK13_03310 [Mycobacterium innocens]|uniref:Uncharacterized protein n=2 Tax=Mycobacterium innocens TaxID=2341083 RepID=A0A498Q5H4_9MYCO|nr:hypothetical protein LAUMK13_03310 [Mycobacterium innocens]
MGGVVLAVVTALVVLAALSVRSGIIFGLVILAWPLRAGCAADVAHS